MLTLEYGGFAMAVKAGLESILASGLKYALVVQHDRAFCHSVARADMAAIYAHLESQIPGCRYIGFPSGTSKLLAAKTAAVYQLHELLASRTRPLRHADPSMRLVPCIHWLDSNHLVDAARALEMYRPYSHAPERLMSRLGGKGVNRFRLRHGDFIEERFGVEQRTLLASAKDEPSACLEFFDWFGSYMLDHTLEGADLAAAREAMDPRVDRLGRVTYVEHIDARGMVPPSARRPGSARQAAKRRSQSGRRSGQTSSHDALTRLRGGAVSHSTAAYYSTRRRAVAAFSAAAASMGGCGSCSRWAPAAITAAPAPAPSERLMMDVRDQIDLATQAASVQAWAEAAEAAGSPLLDKQTLREAINACGFSGGDGGGDGGGEGGGGGGEAAELEAKVTARVEALRGELVGLGVRGSATPAEAMKAMSDGTTARTAVDALLAGVCGTSL